MFLQGEDGTEPGAEEQLKSVSDKAASDVNNALEGLKNGDLEAAWPLISNYVIPAAGALLALIIGYLFAKLLARMVSSPVRKRVDETLGRFVGKMVYYSVMICIIIAVLSTVGIEVASFAAILAAAGFAVGMAFQGTLGNFASGIMLLVFRPFKVGDVVNAAGVTAKINEIDLFTTTMDTPDNRRIIVPNSAIASGTIENLSHHPERRVDVSVGTDYTADIRETREVLQKAAEALQSNMVMGDGRGCQIVLGTLGDSCVNWTVRFWTKAENYWPVTEALTESVKNHLDDAGIGIPYPQLDIHMPDANVSMSPDHS